MPDDQWFYCKDCNVFLSDESEIKTKHIDWGHLVKLRMPIEKRMVYGTKDYENKFLKLDVDGDSWFVTLQLNSFRNDRKGAVAPVGNSLFNPPFDNVVRKMRHLYPNIPMSVEKLKKLLTSAIRKGVYTYYEEGRAKILLCLNTDLRLLPRKLTSKWVCTTSARLSRLTEKEEVSMQRAIKNAPPFVRE